MPIITPEPTTPEVVPFHLLVTKYYITTPETAQGISAIKAMQLGCGNGTYFWWEIINHPTENLSAIVFRPDVASNSEEILYENGSTIISQNDLVEEQVLIDGGWFVDNSQNLGY